MFVKKQQLPHKNAPTKNTLCAHTHADTHTHHTPREQIHGGGFPLSSHNDLGYAARLGVIYVFAATEKLLISGCCVPESGEVLLQKIRFG